VDLSEVDPGGLSGVPGPRTTPVASHRADVSASARGSAPPVRCRPEHLRGALHGGRGDVLASGPRPSTSTSRRDSAPPSAVDPPWTRAVGNPMRLTTTSYHHTGVFPQVSGTSPHPRRPTGTRRSRFRSQWGSHPVGVRVPPLAPPPLTCGDARNASSRRSVAPTAVDPRWTRAHHEPLSRQRVGTASWSGRSRTVPDRLAVP
jgi:hypothetical protein